ASSREPARIPVAVVDEDGSAVSKTIVEDVRADKTLSITALTADEARQSVRAGKVTVGVIIPSGFGEASARAFFPGRDKPEIELLYAPSHAAELGLVRGLLAGHVIESVSREIFGGLTGQRVIDETLDGLDDSGMPAGQKA